MELKIDRPELVIIGEDGNAFSILGKARKALKKEGATKEQIDQVLDEAMSGDYNHLLATMIEYFEVMGEEE